MQSQGWQGAPRGHLGLGWGGGHIWRTRRFPSPELSAGEPRACGSRHEGDRPRWGCQLGHMPEHKTSLIKDSGRRVHKLEAGTHRQN